ncbi:polyprotein [Elysia marginata]|uniref:Polyprotein n=1 Tax=Elysia marginata TaxID=1093978 RepID=A0AAV4G6I2_9GAST|nr:polyprotein [Elysia marginata]
MDDPICSLYHGGKTAGYVLSSCKVALSEGRCTWRHNKMLQDFASGINIAKGQIDSPTRSFAIFTREGVAKTCYGKSNKGSTQRKGLLCGFDDSNRSLRM